MVDRIGLFEHAGYTQARRSLFGARVEPARDQDRRHPNSLFCKRSTTSKPPMPGMLVDYQTTRGAMAIIGKEIGSRII
jgi:hypothetical protein